MGLGLTVGIQHAFEPDHIAAVSTQISKSKYTQKSTKQSLKESFTKSSVLDALWGAGHTTTLVLIGLLVYVFTITIQNQIFLGLEFGVGIMLVLLGINTIFNWKKRFFKFRHRHSHQHSDGTTHFDEHDHSDSNHRHGHKSYFIGLVHGLAGSGSLVVLTATTMENPVMMIGFILIFGIGSIIGMSIVSSLMGLSITAISKFNTIHKIFQYFAGTFSFLIGANIIFEIVVLDNLLGIF